VWSALGAGIGGATNTSAYAVAVLANGQLLTGGDFYLAGGRNSASFARYSFGEPTPIIAVQPRPATSCPGRTTSFSTIPSGSGPFTYQWRKAGIPINAAANPSAASGTLVLAVVQVTDAGAYDCVVTGACGTVITTAATLTVTICPCSIADIAGGGPNGDQPDGQITGADFAAFIAAFGRGEMPADAIADIAGAGDDRLQPDGTIDGNDFIAFINALMTGCGEPLPGG
jgi:hypothetical protein